MRSNAATIDAMRFMSELYESRIGKRILQPVMVRLELKRAMDAGQPHEDQ